MPTSVTFRCDACDAAAVVNSDDGDTPPGWRFVRPEGIALLLCGGCAPANGRAFSSTPDLCRRLMARGIELKICATLWGIGTARRTATLRSPGTVTKS